MSQSITYKYHETPKGHYEEYLNFDGVNLTQNKYRYYITDNIEQTIQGLCVNGGFFLDKTTPHYVVLARSSDNVKINLWFHTNEVEIIEDHPLELS